jgi:gliding motility-associated-like protein
MLRLLFSVFLVINSVVLLAQVINDANIIINNGTSMYILTDVRNENNGSIDNSGTIILNGNWENNNLSNYAFINSSPGTVRLIGGNQTIGGSNSTKFYNLSLEGTGIKSLSINAEVEGNLNLNDRELATNQYVLHVSNTAVNAINFTTGFVSSTSNGYLSRAMNSTQPYIFPVGSSFGTPRYRPVELVPNNTSHQVMGVRFANNDPNSEGFDRNTTDGQVGNINSQYFHNIHRVSGTTPNDVFIYFDSQNDGTFNEITHWDDQPSPRWEVTTTAMLNSGTPLSSLSINGWNDYTLSPFALYGCTPSTQPSSIQASSTTICGNQTITLTVVGGSLGSGAQWVWYENNCSGTQIGTGSSIQVNPTNTTTYYVNAVGSCGTTPCVSITINVSAIPQINISSNSPLCVGQTLNLSATGGNQYQWSGPSGFSSSISNPSINNVNTNHSGLYNVTVTNADGCSNTAQVNVVINTLPQGTVTSSQTVCEGENISIEASGGTNYLWSGPNNFTSSSSVINIPAANQNHAGTYYVTITNANNCSVVLNTNVSVQLLPQITVSYSGATCEGNNITLQVSPSGLQSYQWSGPNNFISNQQNPVINNTNFSHSGTYTVTVTHSCGTTTASVNVVVYERPDIISMNTQNESCKDMKDGQILPNISGGMLPYSYLWNNGSTQSQLSQLSEGTYSLTISDANGCSTTGTAIITKGEHDCFFIPTVFSPNGDGANDVLYVRGHGIKELIFRIYDRWGNMIFESTSPQVGWDGTYKGKPMNAGAYAYYAKIVFANGTEKEIRENITLIR